MEHTSSTKYIPPHRRTQEIGLTRHGQERQQQRQVSTPSIHSAIQSGEVQIDSTTSTYRDEMTQVVLGGNKKIITVLENKRNTQFDLLQISETKKQALLKKAQQGNDSAMCELATLYLSGDLGKRDIVQAKRWLTLAAEKKRNSHAMCLLANLYEDGSLGKRDSEMAFSWLEKAAERKNRYALAVCGQKYIARYLELRSADNTRKEVKDALLKKAVHFLEESANKGSTRAQWQIAQIHEEGWLGEKDIKKAIVIYSQAARLGSPASLDTLNEYVGKEISAEEFDDILEEASRLIARTSSAIAVQVGLKQIQGLLGKKPQRGLFLIEEAAKKRNLEAIQTVAKCYQKGWGCEPDLEKTQYWLQELKKLLQQSAAQGNVNSLWTLGKLFLKGTFGEINLEQAENYFIQAAATGEPLFNYDLGKLYYEGRLGNKEPAEGAVWIKQAIQLATDRAFAGDIESTYLLVSTQFRNVRL